MWSGAGSQQRRPAPRILPGVCRLPPPGPVLPQLPTVPLPGTAFLAAASAACWPVSCLLGTFHHCSQAILAAAPVEGEPDHTACMPRPEADEESQKTQDLCPYWGGGSGIPEGSEHTHEEASPPQATGMGLTQPHGSPTSPNPYIPVAAACHSTANSPNTEQIRQ